MTNDHTWILITGEFPPKCGGVGDYTDVLAGALARTGASVHVWCPTGKQPPRRDDGVTVKQVTGLHTMSSIWHLERTLTNYPRPRTVLLQYVPQAFGMRGMNVFVPCWLFWRRLRGDDVRVMFHEPFVEFARNAGAQNVVAFATRAMAALLLRASRVVYVSTSAWSALLRSLAPAGHAEFEWLPIPCTVPVELPSPDTRAERERMLEATGARRVIGHFGTYGGMISPLLLSTFVPLLTTEPDIAVVLMGRGSEAFGEHLARMVPSAGGRIVATGAVEASAVSSHLQACDLVVQPYPDGVTTRRTTVMCSLASGVPVVTTHGRFTEEVWEEAGIPMAPATDASTLVALVRSLMADEALRATIGQRGLALYQQRFALELTVATLRA